MSQIANTFSSYDSVGNREDLADVIYDISPTKTPVISSMGRVGAEATLFEWQTDSLDSTDTGNAHIEGDDVTSFQAITPTVRVGNYTQISRKTVIVSGTQEAVRKAGRRSDFMRAVTRRGTEIKRDMEAIVLANLAGAAGSDTVARQTATLGAWLNTNTVFNSGGAPAGADSGHTSGVPTSARTDSGTQVALTETMFKDAIELVWVSGGDVDALTAYPGPFNKGVISGFGGIATHTVNIDSDQPSPMSTIAAVDVYVSDFGNVRIMPNRFGRERDLYLLDPEYLKIAELRSFQLQDLAKTGDAKKKLLLQEWGLRVNQEAALGGIFDLTTS